MKDKIKELSKRTIKVLESTKKYTDKYYEERKKADYYLRYYKDDEAF